MTLEDAVKILRETGLPVAYDHYSVQDAPDPPYIAVTMDSTDNFFADNRVAVPIAEFEVELCTGKKDPPTERRLTEVFNTHDIAWQKTDEGYAESDGLYSIFYQFEEVYNG